VEENKQKTIVNRLKNKIFLLALAGFVYQVLSNYGVALPSEMWKIGCDVVSYIFIGTGIYSTFE